MEAGTAQEETYVVNLKNVKYIEQKINYFSVETKLIDNYYVR